MRIFEVLERELKRLDQITDDPDDPNNIAIITQSFGISESEAIKMANSFKEQNKMANKKLYCIIRVNKCECNSTELSPCNTLEEAKKMLGFRPNYDIIVEGEMHWVNARVKGVKLASGEVILYGEYEREYFVQHQLEKLKTLAL